MSESDFPIPPPTFDFLVFSLKRQAEMHLGLMMFGEDKAVQPDLPAARHMIDLLAMIAEKTRGNLSLEEKLAIDNSLTELRFRFVQISGEVAAAASRGAAGSGRSDDGGAKTGSGSADGAQTDDASGGAQAGDAHGGAQK